MIEIRTSSFSQTGLTDDSNRKSCMKSAEKHWGRKSKRLETRVGFDIYQRKQENYKNSQRTKSCALLKAEAPEWHSSVEIKAEECTQSVTVKQLERNRILILTAEGVVFPGKLLYLCLCQSHTSHCLRVLESRMPLSLFTLSSSAAPWHFPLLTGILKTRNSSKLIKN